MLLVREESSTVKRLMKDVMAKNKLSQTEIDQYLEHLKDEPMEKIAVRYLVQHQCDLWENEVGGIESDRLCTEGEKMLQLDKRSTSVIGTELRGVFQCLKKEFERMLLLSIHEPFDVSRQLARVHSHRRLSYQPKVFLGGGDACTSTKSVNQPMFSTSDLSKNLDCLKPLLEIIKQDKSVKKDSQREKEMKKLEAKIKCGQDDDMSVSKSIGTLCGSYDLERSLVDEVLRDLVEWNMLESEKVKEMNAQIYQKDEQKVKFYELANVIRKYVKTDKMNKP